jgi:hypothetical protein
MFEETKLDSIIQDRKREGEVTAWKREFVLILFAHEHPTTTSAENRNCYQLEYK